MLKKIISGGQTGVDRAALDAALSINFNSGGYCPKGRLAEDGKIARRYPLIELNSKKYADRTLKNVNLADGTVIFFYKDLKSGTKLTAKFCNKNQKPCLMIDASCIEINTADKSVIEFIDSKKIEILNVAGPRHSQWATGYNFTYACILAALSNYTCIKT